MSDITILDTGFIKSDSSGTKASVLANSGSAITLKSVTVTYNRKANVDTTPIINANTGPVAGFGTVETGKIVIQGALDSNITADMDLMDDINDLLTTFGIKLLYYSSASDGYRDITDSLGAVNKDDIHKTNDFGSTATPHLHVRVTSFQISQTAKSQLRYTLECVETT